MSLSQKQVEARMAVYDDIITFLGMEYELSQEEYQQAQILIKQIQKSSWRWYMKFHKPSDPFLTL